MNHINMPEVKIAVVAVSPPDGEKRLWTLI